MKLHSVKSGAAASSTKHAFTLIEMIGVLAVIAILAAMLIPKVFSAIADAKVNNAIVSAETVKTAAADHYGKYGKFDVLAGNTINGFAVPYHGYDTNILMAEALLDKPFQTKIGTGWDVELLAAPLASQTTVSATDDGTFALMAASGGAATNSIYGQYVLEAVITGVAEADAQAISQRIDGQVMSSALGVDDTAGKVKYAHPTAAGGSTTVYIYLTHR